MPPYCRRANTSRSSSSARACESHALRRLRTGSGISRSTSSTSSPSGPAKAATAPTSCPFANLRGRRCLLRPDACMAEPARFQGLTIFVTGGAGFIGSAVVRHLLETTEAFIVNIDKLTYSANLDSIPQSVGNPRYAFRKVDICNGPALRDLFDQYMPAAVLNLAAE